MLYLIDGHNLIGSGRIPGVHLAQEDDEYRLVQWLRARQPNLRQPIVVVFDSGIPGGRSLDLSGGGVTVIFAPQHRSHADQIIHQRVKREVLRGDITVVSDDAVLADAVKSLGAKVMRTAEFVERVKRQPRRRRAHPRKLSPEPKLSHQEIEAWLQLFEKRNESG